MSLSFTDLIKRAVAVAHECDVAVKSELEESIELDEVSALLVAMAAALVKAEQQP